MSFNSFGYLAFLLFAVAGYYSVPKKAKRFFLLAASYLFYTLENGFFLLILVFVTAVTYIASRLLESISRGKKAVFIFALAATLAPLFLMKFFVSVWPAMPLSEHFGSAAANTAAFIMPAGISFFTFQSLGYLIDVFKGKHPAEKSIVNYALFVSFFPQLTAGPVERSEELIPQLISKKRFSFDNIKNGITPILWGLFKKCVIADAIAPIVSRVFGDVRAFSGLAVALASAAFAIQVYFDFSAYTDIARGSATMLGIRLSENFRRPYFAVSVRDYWKRWHITMTRWFRDYIYIPLGGNRKSIARTAFNILVVFIISGLWHGTGLNFIAWGAINGFCLIIEMLARKYVKLPQKLEKVFTSVPATAIRILFTFVIVCLSLTFYVSPDISGAFTAIRQIFAHPLCNQSLYEIIASLGTGLPQAIMLSVTTAVVFALDAAAEFGGFELDKRLSSSLLLRYCVWFILCAAILLFGIYGSGYDPHDFIYIRM